MARAGKFARRGTRWNALSHGVTAGIAVFLLLVGGGVSYAAWTTGADATSTTGAATLSISTSGFDSNAFTFKNNALASTGSVTLTNNTVTSSTTAGAVKMTLGYTGDAALAAKLNVSIWSTVNTSACTSEATVPGSATTGHWDAVATAASPITGTIAKGSSANYCIRVSGAERGDLASTSGALTIQPTISASLTVGNWSQSATASTTQKTAWIFPAFNPPPNTWYQIVNQSTSNCVDVYAMNTTSGTGLVDFACKTGNTATNYNQHWKFTQTSGNYYGVTSRNAQTMRMDVVGASKASLAAVDQQTSSASRVSQEWQLQTVTAGVYQFVNRNSGMCLQTNNTNVYPTDVEYAQATCDGSGGQRYTLRVIFTDVPAVTLTCAAASGGGVTYSWTGAAIDTYNFEAALAPGSTWTSIGNAAQGSSSITTLPAALTSVDGKYSVRAKWLTNQLATTNLWRTTTAGTTSLSCTEPVPVISALTCSPSPDRAVTISWGHIAPSAYTIELFSNGSWINFGTAAAGATSFTVAGGQNWYDGVRNLRVVSGPQSVEFSVYNSGYASSYLWCLPLQTITPVTCVQQSSGDYITLSWPRTSAGTSVVRMTVGGINFTRAVTYSGSTASVQFLDDDVRYATAGTSILATFQLEANGAVVGLLPDRTVTITGTGTGQNDKNLFCQ